MPDTGRMEFRGLVFNQVCLADIYRKLIDAWSYSDPFIVCDMCDMQRNWLVLYIRGEAWGMLRKSGELLQLSGLSIFVPAFRKCTKGRDSPPKKQEPMIYVH